jgi:hypothetical protein
MTLVAALSGSQGTIFFADTDEIVAGYSKKTIDKMEVWDFADRPFRFAIAGATTDGTYADALQSELSGALFKVDAFDLRKITQALSDTLAAFYAKHIWPRAGDKPLMQYLITVQPLPKGHTEVFHISETAVNAMGLTTHWKSIGVGSYLADYLFNRLLGGGEDVAQLCAAAVYAAKEVRENIDGVGPIDRIPVFFSNGAYDELHPADISTIEENLAPLNETLSYVFSDAMDTREIMEEIRREDNSSSLNEILAEMRQKQSNWYKEWDARRERRKLLLEMHAQRIAMKKHA